MHVRERKIPQRQDCRPVQLRRLVNRQNQFDGLAPGRYALQAQPLMGEGAASGPVVEVDVEAGRKPATAQVSLATQ